jgi:transcriptional regulator with XRE-family HTH domain
MLALETAAPDNASQSVDLGIGSVIRQARKTKKLSGDGLSKITGLSRRTIIKIEQDDESVAYGSYLAVARALEIDRLIDVFARGSGEGFAGAPQYYLSGASALSLPPEDGRPPALWYSSSLSNPKNWQVAGKHLTHTGPLMGVIGLWDATSAIARYGVTVPRIWAASPERAVFDLLIDHCEVDESTVPNIQAIDIDDVVDLKQVIQWIDLCKEFLSQAGRTRIQDWLEGGYR